MKRLTILMITALALGLALPSSSEAASWSEVKKLTASDAEADDRFGASVAVSGDVAVAGALYEDAGGDLAGAAYVFYRNQGGTDNWGQVKKLTASDAEAGDVFGVSAAVSGDIAVMGAPREDAGGTDAGAAYVFYRNQGGTDNWGQVKKLTASDAEADDRFGHSVAVSGDIAVVGANWEDEGVNWTGAAYVFYRNQGGTDNWGEVKKLTASDADLADLFGESVAVSGDIAVVGAYLKNVGGSDAGAAYVFYRNQGGTDNWGQVKKLTASDIETDDDFGFSVAVSGDIAVVGAAREDAGGDSAGAAYVFYRNHGGTDNWGELKKLTASDAEAGDFFGWSAALSGGIAVVGAYHEDAGGSNAGAAYIFSRNQGGANNWGEVEKLTASDAGSGDYFGHSVAVSGDIAVVGAGSEDAEGTDAGAAYVYGAEATEDTPTPKKRATPTVTATATEVSATKTPPPPISTPPPPPTATPFGGPGGTVVVPPPTGTGPSGGGFPWVLTASLLAGIAGAAAAAGWFLRASAGPLALSTLISAERRTCHEETDYSGGDRAGCGAGAAQQQ